MVSTPTPACAFPPDPFQGCVFPTQSCAHEQSPVCDIPNHQNRSWLWDFLHSSVISWHWDFIHSSVFSWHFIHSSIFYLIFCWPGFSKCENLHCRGILWIATLIFGVKFYRSALVRELWAEFSGCCELLLSLWCLLAEVHPN